MILSKALYFQAIPAGLKAENKEVAGNISLMIVSSPVQETVAKENFWRLDVGPILRQLLTRTEDSFGGPIYLTLRDKLVWGQVPE